VFKKDTLKMPVELLMYANANKLHKAVGIYLLLKAFCDGHIILSRHDRLQIMDALQIKTVASFNKHLNRLISLNWVGLDGNTGTYYVRGFNYLRKQQDFKSSLSACFYVASDSCTIKEFIQGGLINSDIRRKNHGRKAKIIKLAGRPALKKESAIQGLIAMGKITAYCGLSNSLIGKILGVSKSQADRIKKRLVKLGYIRTNPKYKHLATFNHPDWILCDHLPGRRYQFHVRVTSQGKLYMLYERTYDEIIPCMEFSNQKSIIRKLKKT
jgi:hypothetical protein